MSREHYFAGLNTPRELDLRFLRSKINKIDVFLLVMKLNLQRKSKS